MARVLTIGTFDTIHAGHIGLFNQCQRLAGTNGHVTVGINSDDFVTKYKGATPLIPLASRRAVIAALRTVDETVINHIDYLQPQLIADAEPDLLVIGQDWALKDYPAQMHLTPNWLNNHNIQLVYVPRTGDWSSTAIKNHALG